MQRTFEKCIECNGEGYVKFYDPYQGQEIDSCYRCNGQGGVYLLRNHDLITCGKQPFPLATD